MNPIWRTPSCPLFLCSHLVLGFALTLAACSSLPPENHSSTAAQPTKVAGPYRTTAEGDTKRLMLEGHDPVAYFTQNTALRGNPAFTIDRDGVTYRFVSESNRNLFTQNPGRFMPQFGGYCSNGINYAIAGGGGGGPNTWRIYRGKLYVFGGQKARDHFEMDTERNLALAHKYWDEELAGYDAAQTRTRRMRDKVPHYRSDWSLQREWESKLAAGTLPVMPGAAQVVPAAP